MEGGTYFFVRRKKEKEKEGNIWRRKISFWPGNEDDGEG